MPSPPFPIQVAHGTTVEDAEQLADVVIALSEQQVESSQLARSSGDVADDFRMSCDALNYWRACWRLREELGTKSIDVLGELPRQLKSHICRKRRYASDEFDFAVEATRERARTPLGLSPLALAYTRSFHSDFRLISPPELAESAVANRIASIANELQRLQGPEKNILLPVDQLRQLLGKRKVVVSGALRQLVQTGVLREVDGAYHTRKAREYRFAGVHGNHFREGKG